MNWRKVLGCYDGPGKNEARYKTENGEKLPNSAEFSGDKWPEGKNVAQTEVSAWKRDNSAFKSDVKRENPKDLHGSALTGPSVIRRGMAEKSKENPEPAGS
jgi:hypothetical protein